MMKVFSALFLIMFCFVGASFAESYVVKQGDTLSGILSDKYNVLEVNEIIGKIKKIYPSFVLRADGKIFFNSKNVKINAASDADILISRNAEGSLEVILDKHENEVMNVLVTGEIKTNLFDAVRRAGEDAELAAMLAGIFEWEIDFFKDLRSGDKFAVLVEKKFVNDKYAGYGKILAADFYNGGKIKRALYFEDGKTKGYFDEDGRGLERGFLRVPINYARITSRFTNNRLHPVLKEYRPHYGVDYAARIGTPVMATASGVIETMSYTKANGNYIVIRHSNGYKTYYLHLNGFNRAFRRGKSVAQGQIIGYVGMTGYATGPHLDYRINRYGKWLNPLKFVATAKSLKKEQKEKFFLIADNGVKMLEKAFPLYAQTAAPSGPANTIYLIQF